MVYSGSSVPVSVSLASATLVISELMPSMISWTAQSRYPSSFTFPTNSSASAASRGVKSSSAICSIRWSLRSRVWAVTGS